MQYERYCSKNVYATQSWLTNYGRGRLNSELGYWEKCFEKSA